MLNDSEHCVPEDEEMDSETVQDNDVYGLVRRLCERLYSRHYQPEEHPYLPQQDNDEQLRKLKARAYEILLNKSGQDYGESPSTLGYCRLADF